MSKKDVEIMIGGKKFNQVVCDGCGKVLCLVDSEDNPYTLDGLAITPSKYFHMNIWSPLPNTDYCCECSDDYRLCDCCNTIVEHGAGHEIHGSFICDDCFDNNYQQCEECVGWFKNDELITTGYGHEVCPDCLEYNYSRCQDCGEYYHTDDMTYIEGYGDVCQDCYDSVDCHGNSRYIRCEDCGDYYRAEESRYNEGNGCYYCDSCYDNLDFDDIPDYHCDDTPIRPRDEEGKIIAMNGDFNELRHKKPFMGTEWEMCRGGKDYAQFLNITRALGIPHDEGECKIEQDSSVPDGAEIITMPAPLEYFTKFLKLEEGFKLAREYGYKSHDGGYCGAHIHVDRKYFDEAMMNPEYGFIIICQNNRDWLVPFSRRNPNHMAYCELHEDTKPFISESFIPSIEGHNERDEVFDRLERLQRWYNGHRAFINFNNYATIELRFFRGSLKPNTIRANHQLVAMMAYAVRHLSDVQLCNVTLKWFKRFALKKGYTEFLAYLDERGIMAS